MKRTFHNFRKPTNRFRNKFYWGVRRMLTNPPQTSVSFKRRASDLVRRPSEKLVANYAASLGG